MNKKMIFWVFVFAGILFPFLPPSATSEQKWKVPAENFDGSKFAQRYALDREDFYAEIVGGEMFIVLKDGVTISDQIPIFEVPDMTKQDLFSALRTRLKSQDLTVAEMNDYLRFRDGL